MSTETVKFPVIQTQSAYHGLYIDRAPNIKAAGKLTATVGDNVAQCMKPKDDRPPSPELVRRFRGTFRPEAGERTVFYSKVYDPHRKWAEEMRHGAASHDSTPLKDLVNPRPKTLYQMRTQDRLEQDYASSHKSRLGQVPDPGRRLPKDLDPLTHTFGEVSVPDSGGGSLINPRKTWAEVEAESTVAHDLYKFSHKDYYIGEQVDRRYTVPEFDHDKRFGKATNIDHSGRLVRKSLKWNTEMEKEDGLGGAKIVNKRVDDFRERNTPQLGKVLDPIKETMRVGPEYTHGILYKTDTVSVGDLLYDRLPNKFLLTREYQKGLLASMRQKLRDLNYHTFPPDLIKAFQFYDPDGKGTIDVDDLREVMIKFELPIDPWMLEQVFDYCDVNRDGQINYKEFGDYLNWRDPLPRGFAAVPEDLKYKLPTVDDRGRVINLVEMSKTFQNTGPLSVMGEIPQLQKKVDKSVKHYHTTNQMYNSVVPPKGLDTSNYRALGVPSIRSDLPPPKSRRIDDRQNNYGDESTVYGLTNPSIYSTHGVYEKDLLIPRTKQEICEIFSNIGVEMSEATFEKLYSEVASVHPNGEVSVESFRNALDDAQARQIMAGKHPLAV